MHNSLQTSIYCNLTNTTRIFIIETSLISDHAVFAREQITNNKPNLELAKNHADTMR